MEVGRGRDNLSLGEKRDTLTARPDFSVSPQESERDKLRKAGLQELRSKLNLEVIEYDSSLTLARTEDNILRNEELSKKKGLSKVMTGILGSVTRGKCDDIIASKSGDIYGIKLVIGAIDDIIGRDGKKYYFSDSIIRGYLVGKIDFALWKAAKDADDKLVEHDEIAKAINYVSILNKIDPAHAYPLEKKLAEERSRFEKIKAEENLPPKKGLIGKLDRLLFRG